MLHSQHHRAPFRQSCTRRRHHQTRQTLHAASDGQTTTEVTDPKKAALLARIQKAKQYKSGGDASSTSSAPPTPAPAPETPKLPTAPQKVDWGAMTAFLDSQGKSGAGPDDPRPPMPVGGEPLSAEQQRQLEEIERQRQQRFEAAKDKSDSPSPRDEDKTAINIVLNATQAPYRGSATQAAGFLESVLQDKPDSPDSSLRMEEFTQQKEARIRQMGAEILTVDPTYRASPSGAGDAGEIVSTTRNAGAAAQLLGMQPEQLLEEIQDAVKTQQAQTMPLPTPFPSPSASATTTTPSTSTSSEATAEAYAPKVSTWGVFPRPKDISAAYGGGRNLKPGQALETEEQKAAREQAYREALKLYRQTAGLDVDPEDEAKAETLYEEGLALSKQGQLQAAYFKFQEVSNIVPLKSKFGGLAGLQAAIILDSQGGEYTEQAKKMYRQLQGHAVASVAKKSKQMLFGFQAAQFLKADTISYSTKPGEYTRYFRSIIDKNKVYVSSEEEKRRDEEAARLASLIAVAVLVGPIALIGALVGKAGPPAM